MPSDVSEIDLSLAYRLPLIYRAALIRKIADSNCKKAQALYEKDYEDHVGFEPRFAAHATFLSNVAPLMASAEDHMTFERYYELLPCHTGPNWAISVEL